MRFLNYFIEEQEKGNQVDKPPGRELWREAPKRQLKDSINRPVNALSNILSVNSEDNTIGFHNQIQRQLGDEELMELEMLAHKEPYLYNTANMTMIWKYCHMKPSRKLFAEALGVTGNNGQFTLIPVRPDWSDPVDLLGYKDLSGRFKPGPLTEVLVEALRPENQHKPYFICLDEMNLSRVEHYFSDLLCVLATQDWHKGKIQTQELISSTLLDTPEDQVKYASLGIPENVFLIGTVNMDETTHPFSKKVLDRANTLEFNYINLQQYPDFSRALFIHL